MLTFLIIHLQLRSLSSPSEIAHNEDILRIFLMACEVRTVKLSIIGLSCLQKLISHDAVSPSALKAILSTLKDVSVDKYLLLLFGHTDYIVMVILWLSYVCMHVDASSILVTLIIDFHYCGFMQKLKHDIMFHHCGKAKSCNYNLPSFYIYFLFWSPAAC